MTTTVTNNIKNSNKHMYMENSITQLLKLYKFLVGPSDIFTYERLHGSSGFIRLSDTVLTAILDLIYSRYYINTIKTMTTRHLVQNCS